MIKIRLMTRKTFYLIIACGLATIFVYILLKIYLLRDLELPNYDTSRLKNCIATLIIFYEAVYAKNPFRTIVLILFPINLIGLFFSIMHWPYGQLIFLSSLLIILTSLLINAAKSVTNSLEKLIVLVYPISRLILLITNIYHLPRTWWLIDFAIMGLTVVYLLVRHAKRNLDAH